MAREKQDITKAYNQKVFPFLLTRISEEGEVLPLSLVYTLEPCGFSLSFNAAAKELNVFMSASRLGGEGAVPSVTFRHQMVNGVPQPAQVDWQGSDFDLFKREVVNACESVWALTC